jgi:hypothetical protein
MGDDGMKAGREASFAMWRGVLGSADAGAAARRVGGYGLGDETTSTDASAARLTDGIF